MFVEFGDYDDKDVYLCILNFSQLDMSTKQINDVKDWGSCENNVLECNPSVALT